MKHRFIVYYDTQILQIPNQLKKITVIQNINELSKIPKWITNESKPILVDLKTQTAYCGSIETIETNIIPKLLQEISTKFNTIDEI